MANIEKYIPSGKGPFPAVIAFPGLVEKLEGGRNELALQSLNKFGIAGFGVIYDGIDAETLQDGRRKLEFNFNMDACLRDVREAATRIVRNPLVNTKRLALLTNSISSIVIAYAISERLFEELGLEILAHISVSPWVSYQTYSTKAKREELDMALDNNLISEIPLSQSTLDQDREIIRVIPAVHAPGLKRLDAIEELRRNYHHKKMEIMTLIGGKDTISEPKAMINYHQAQHGDDSGLVVFTDEEHAINPKLTIPYTDKFFKQILTS